MLPHVLTAQTPHGIVESERLPGVDMAEGITQITGVAISPLLGISVIGAWQYWKSSEGRRPLLPWYCQPYVWGTGFALLALCFLKDLFGTAAPPLIKKPLDVAELFENKASALVACSAFVPFVVSQMARYDLPTNAGVLGAAEAHLASIVLVAGGGFNVWYLTVPLAMAAFLIVWLAAHAINVLIVLCPFGFIDAGLKLFKLGLLSSVVVASFISPFLGLAVSLTILCVAAFLAPWAFRLTVFGTLFGLDVLFPSRARRLADPNQPQAFIGRGFARVPVRTYGWLRRTDDDKIEFCYRPWLVLPQRSLRVPEGELAITKGVFFPSVRHRASSHERHRMLLLFLPRYRKHEQAIASHFRISDVRDGRVITGFRAVRSWLADTVGTRRAMVATG
jgi:hypothetical protein